MDKLILKLTQKCKGPRSAKSFLKMKNKIGRLPLPDFKTSYKATVIQIVKYWYEDGQIDH